MTGNDVMMNAENESYWLRCVCFVDHLMATEEPCPSLLLASPPLLLLSSFLLFYILNLSVLCSLN